MLHVFSHSSLSLLIVNSLFTQGTEANIIFSVIERLRKARFLRFCQFWCKFLRFWVFFWWHFTLFLLWLLPRFFCSLNFQMLARFLFNRLLFCWYQTINDLLHFGLWSVIQGRHFSNDSVLLLNDSVGWLSSQQFVDEHLLVALLSCEVLDCQFQLIEGVSKVEVEIN